MGSLAILLGVAAWAALRIFHRALCREPGETAEKTLQNWERVYHWDVTELRRGLSWYRAEQKETVEITSFDGLRLVADYVPAQGRVRGRVILFHGYHGGVEDYSAALPFYHQLGFDLLVPDQRSHHRSQGQYIGFGLLERRDCCQWAQEADRRWGRKPTFLAGVSMGASTVLMAAGEPLPEDVRGIAADCGFTEPREIMIHVAQHFLHLPKLLAAAVLYPMETLLFRLHGSCWLGSYSTLRAMEKNRLPVLFVHGEADDFVPMEMTRQNYAACRGEKYLLLVPGAGHCQGYLRDMPRYQRELRAFLYRYSQEPTASP